MGHSPFYLVPYLISAVGENSQYFCLFVVFVVADLQSTGKLTAAQRSLSKVDKTGMKSISSFFGGGPKKGAKK